VNEKKASEKHFYVNKIFNVLVKIAYFMIFRSFTSKSLLKYI